MPKRDEKSRLKMAIIAGASHAVKYKAGHPKAQDQEVIQHVTSEVDEILAKIDE